MLEPPSLVNSPSQNQSTKFYPEEEIKTSKHYIQKMQCNNDKEGSTKMYRGKIPTQDEKSMWAFMLYIIFLGIFIAFILLEFPISNSYCLLGPIFNKIKPTPERITTMSDVKQYCITTVSALFNENYNTAYNCDTTHCANATADEPTLYHFDSKFNYLIGCRLSSTHYTTTPNNGNFSNSFPYFRKLDNAIDYSFAPITNIPNKNMYISTVTKKIADNLANEYLDQIIGYNLKTLQLDFMYYNENTQLASTILVKFKVKRNGLIVPLLDQMYYLPTSFNFKIKERSIIIVKLFLIVVIASLLLIALIIDIKKLTIQIKDAIITGKFQSHWTLFLELITIIFTLITIVMWSVGAIKLSVIHKFLLPAEESSYNYYYEISTKTYFLIRGYGISVFLIFIRILSIAYQKFPAFDILFMTFSKSISILLCFTVITIVLLLGFSFAANRIFGYESIKYSTMMSTVMELFKSGIGLSIFNDLRLSDKQMGAAFYIIYVTLFYILISKLSISFIIGVYNKKWEENHEIVSANARLLSLKTQEFLFKIYRLFTCKNPTVKSSNCCKILKFNINQLNEKECPYKTQEQENSQMDIARKKISSEHSFRREYNQTKVQCIFLGKNTSCITHNKQNDDSHNRHLSLITTYKNESEKEQGKDATKNDQDSSNTNPIKINNTKLNKETKHNKKLTINQIHSKFEKVLAVTSKCTNEKILGLERLRKYSIKCLITLIIRVLFIIFYLWFALRNLNVYNTYFIEESVRSFIESPSKDVYFYNITTPNELQTWFTDVIQKFKSYTPYSINSHMTTFSDPFGKIYYRRIKLNKNTNSATNEVIKYVRSGKVTTKDMNFTDEYRIEDDVLDNSSYQYKFYSKSKDDLPNKIGAYVFKLTSEQLIKDIEFVPKDHISITNIIFDLMVYEATSNVIVFSRAEIVQNPFGVFEVDHNVLSFTNGFYSGLKGVYAISDIAALILFTYLLINEIMKFVKRFPPIVNDQERNASYKYESPASNTTCKACLRILDLDSAKFKNMNCCERTIMVILHSLKAIVIFLLNFIKAVASYVLNFSHILYLLHILSMFNITILWYCNN